jgi:hypothetical protein
VPPYLLDLILHLNLTLHHCLLHLLDLMLHLPLVRLRLLGPALLFGLVPPFMFLNSTCDEMPSCLRIVMPAWCVTKGTRVRTRCMGEMHNTDDDDLI